MVDTCKSLSGVTGSLSTQVSTQVSTSVCPRPDVLMSSVTHSVFAEMHRTLFISPRRLFRNVHIDYKHYQQSIVLHYDYFNVFRAQRKEIIERFLQYTDNITQIEVIYNVLYANAEITKDDILLSYDMFWHSLRILSYSFAQWNTDLHRCIFTIGATLHTIKITILEAILLCLVLRDKIPSTIRFSTFMNDVITSYTHMYDSTVWSQFPKGILQIIYVDNRKHMLTREDYEYLWRKKKYTFVYTLFHWK
jgi:hypothetical protein